MKAFSVIELAKLYGLNRQSIYKRISKGDLSKNSDGKIDLSEAIRVFGEPSQRRTQNVTLQSQATQKSAELDIMRQQVDMLQKQLELAQEREQFQREELKAKNEQIESLQRLLGAPKTTEQPQQAEHAQEQTSESIEPTLIPEPNSIIQEQQREPEPQKRRGLFGRVIRAVLD